ncbi:hypothetical protein GCM10009814_25980 [Lapillicoccus jejuensis]
MAGALSPAVTGTDGEVGSAGAGVRRRDGRDERVVRVAGMVLNLTAGRTGGGAD